MDLFKFDFTEENEGLITEERVAEQFAILQGYFKENRNGYHMDRSVLPSSMAVYIEEFEKNGWIERRSRNGINILDDYLSYHTPDEVIKPFKEAIEKALANPKVSWYETVLPIVNHGGTLIRYKNEAVKEEISNRKRAVVIDAAMELGLDHFINVPSSRGHKMDPFSSKWSRDNVLPMLAERVIPITDFHDMYDFFRENVMFFGRRDWNTNYANGIEVPPYPEYRRLLPSTFDIACLCETEDEKTVKLILDYAGSSFGHMERESDSLNYLYPSGWSYEEYLASLTDKDMRLLDEDKKRLERLHSN